MLYNTIQFTENTHEADDCAIWRPADAFGFVWSARWGWSGETRRQFFYTNGTSKIFGWSVSFGLREICTLRASNLVCLFYFYILQHLEQIIGTIQEYKWLNKQATIIFTSCCTLFRQHVNMSFGLHRFCHSEKIWEDWERVNQPLPKQGQYRAPTPDSLVTTYVFERIRHWNCTRSIITQMASKDKSISEHLRTWRRLRWER